MARILVIDDNLLAAETVCVLLNLHGHETRAAHDGPSGVDQAATWQPDVVLCDIGLPGFDGFDVARRLRRQPAMEQTLLVAVTAYGADTDRRRGMEAGFDSYLIKPVEREILLAVLKLKAGPGAQKRPA